MRKTILILLLHFLKFLELNSTTAQEPKMEEGEQERERDDEEVTENTNQERQIRVSRKSLMELLVMCAPLVHVSCIVWPGFYVVSLDLPMLLISVVPDESRNVLTFFLCLTWESFIVSVVLAWGIYAIFAITSFVLAFKDTVDFLIRRIPTIR